MTRIFRFSFGSGFPLNAGERLWISRATSSSLNLRCRRSYMENHSRYDTNACTPVAVMPVA